MATFSLFIRFTRLNNQVKPLPIAVDNSVQKARQARPWGLASGMTNDLSFALPAATATGTFGGFSHSK